MPQCPDNAPSLQLIVNGQAMTVPVQTLAALLRRLGLEDSAVVAEVNGHIVPGENFAHHALSGGDKVELVRFVGGG